MQKSYMLKSADIERKWHIMDANGQVLGKFATEVAEKLIGKHKPVFTPHMDCGDYVVVINAKEIEVTGNKRTDKMYYRHSGFPGGFSAKSFEQLQATFPERIIEEAVKNMLPKNKMQADRMTRLKVYAGSEHKHQSQLGTE